MTSALGMAHPATVIGWALAHHRLHSCLGLTSSLRVWKQSARAFGPPFGRPELLFFAWPKKSNQKKGHPSSAPFAHPCAKGSRESVGVFGQAVPGLSKTLAASLRPTLRADRPPPAAPQGPLEERGLLPAEATARERSGCFHIQSALAQAQARCSSVTNRRAATAFCLPSPLPLSRKGGGARRGGLRRCTRAQAQATASRAHL